VVCNCLYNLYFIVPLIMIIFLLDFYLTIKGQQYYRKYGIKHLKFGAYELNPLWRKTIRKGKYNYLHLIAIIFVIISIISIYSIDETLFIYEFLIGFILISSSYILTRHIENLTYFWYIGTHPKSIKGLIIKKPDLIYFQSIVTTISLFLLLFIIYIFYPSIFILGGLIFSLLFMLVQFGWYKRLKKMK
jgi:hypothetical protein